MKAKKDATTIQLLSGPGGASRVPFLTVRTQVSKSGLSNTGKNFGGDHSIGMPQRMSGAIHSADLDERRQCRRRWT
jgi:hypothetical protein